MKIGKINLHASYQPLEEGFLWAKEQALDYTHKGDRVGKWYDAALPNREAFCMRDVSHQCNGAHFLGLQAYNKNMLKKFAENISESKDFCSYWEINKDGKPAPVDYKNDDDFWYNLPANFDVIDCCFRQYNWTGDETYIHDKDFNKFYHLSVYDYVKRWDKDDDGTMKKNGNMSYRGIASYLEGQVGDNDIIIGSDLIAAMYAGYKAYSHILKLQDHLIPSEEMSDKANYLKDLFNREWWSIKDQHYYTAILSNGEKLVVNKENVKGNWEAFTPLPLYFDITQEDNRKKACLEVLDNCEGFNVETLSHIPEIYSKHGRVKEGFDTLMKLISPSLKRREYPEVSYSVIGSIMTGLMGLSAKAAERLLITKPLLPPVVDWVNVSNIPLFDGEIDLKVSKDRMTLKQTKGSKMIWQPVFLGHYDTFDVNGERIKGTCVVQDDGETVTQLLIEIEPCIAYTVQINHQKRV